MAVSVDAVPGLRFTLNRVPPMFKSLAVPLVLILAGAAPLLRADESVVGFVRSAETLPGRRADAIQTITFRTGVSRGNYDAVDSTTEVEYGATDRLQVGVSVASHYVHS